MEKIRAHKTTIRRTKSPVSIAIIGKGRLGTSYALAIKKTKQYKLHSHLPARSKSFAPLSKVGGPDVLFIICKDASISAVAKKAIAKCGQNLTLVVHSAGSLPSSILPDHEGVGRLMLHPLQTFAEPSADLFKHITFGVESDEKNALQFAEQFCKALSAHRLIYLSESELPLYHATAVIAANFITLLGGAIEKLSTGLKLKPIEFKQSLTPLMTKSLANVLNYRSKDILTGPMARNDIKTIEKNKAALQASGNKVIAELYEAFHKLAKELK
ncbi:MAG TPA: DUF2520 domain-containing protein [Candidatus Kapabacteria bacterium]|nr:DUF2520 domain-containing protein [Candidatus Kapabacteria bacterium]